MSQPLGSNSNNFAEWWAVMAALEIIPIINKNNEKAYIFTDSEIIYKSLYNKDNSQDITKFSNFIKRAVERIRTGSITIIKVESHVGIAGNEVADDLANEAAEKSLERTYHRKSFPNWEGVEYVNHYVDSDFEINKLICDECNILVKLTNLFIFARLSL